jgi:glycosyltransferase involved in cell wall biosynthesis
LLYEPSEDRTYRRYSLAQRIGNLLDPLPGVYRRLLGSMDKKNVRAATSVLVNSHYSREVLYHVYGISAFVSRLGVDTARFRPLGVAKEKMVVSVGALTSKKGFDFVIRSISQMDATRRPALTIVSNYTELQEEAYLRSLAEQLSVTVNFRAGIPDDELVQIYNRAMLTVYAPIMEPFGFVPLESMACGTPVVGIREAGVRESIRHRETGLLVDRDPHQFAGAIRELLDDPKLRECLGEQARVYVQSEWTWRRSVEELETHLAHRGEVA